MTRLIELFASFQDSRIAHRNIKPANLVFSVMNARKQKSRQLSFEDLIVCNFEMATCFKADIPTENMLCTQDEKCSAIYASPLVQKKVSLLGENKADTSDIVIEVAENQEESVSEDISSSLSERVETKTNT